MNKQDILSQIIDSLRAELDTCLNAAKAASSAATDPDSKAENKYDTRSLEASYLARGQAFRVGELQDAVHAFETLNVRRFDETDVAGLGALVTLKTESEESHYFLGPAAGGTEVHDVMVITPGSPLGQKLMGRKAGDKVPMPGGQALVVAVQ
ncbi:MAG: hypothetical protein JWO08_259 [Verrucomicrobiaceae bacterium]|nr:hypothetical protein [Verrucomicrobiaceae bacterium]